MEQAPSAWSAMFDWQRAWRALGLPDVSIRTLLVCLLCSLFLPLTVTAFYLQSQLAQSQTDAVREGLMSSARTLASLVDNEIDTYLAVGSTIAALQSIETADPVKFQEQAKRALEPLLGSWLTVFDPSGKLLQSTLVDVRLDHPPRGARDVMERAWMTGLPQVSNVVFGPITRRHAAFVEYPVFKDGRPAYSIVIGLNPQRFKMLIDNKFGTQVVAAIIDRTHKFIARSIDHEARLGTTASESWRKEIERSPEGISEVQLVEGTKVLTAYTRTRDGWTVGLAQPLSLVKGPAAQAWNRMLLGGAFLLVLSLLTATTISYTINAGLLGLAADATKLGQGPIVAASTQPIKEVKQISAALNAASVELSRAADHQRDMLDEVSHRSKNFLSLVQAIARQTATHSPDNFLTRFNERLLAIAACQDMLVSRAWRNISLEPLLRSQIAHAQDGRTHVVNLQGPDILVNARAAEALGMAIYELATNAIKYGALAVDDGRIDLTWSIDRETFHIAWSESGGRAVVAPTRKGFGSTVVCQLTKHKLEADVTLDYAAAGVVWRLSCPASRVLETPEHGDAPLPAV